MQNLCPTGALQVLGMQHENTTRIYESLNTQELCTENALRCIQIWLPKTFEHSCANCKILKRMYEKYDQDIINAQKCQRGRPKSNVHGATKLCWGTVLKLSDVSPPNQSICHMISLESQALLHFLENLLQLLIHQVQVK